MKGKHIVIICFSVLLCLLVGVCGIQEREGNRSASISVDVLSDGRSENIKLWMSPSEEYFLFLPGYADLSQVQIRRNVWGSLYLDYKKVVDGMSCSRLSVNEPVTLIHNPLFGYQWNELTILQSGKLPTMFIDVKSGNMDYIHKEKGNKESGTMRLYSADGKLEAMAIVDSLKGRGNSTWQWNEKKPYSLRLNEDADLLGMGAASRWVLLAEAFDRSLMKNKLAYDLARNAGMPYAPDCQWVELYLNGEYAGLYLLSERNEIHPNRVDLPEDASFLVSWESERRLIAQDYPYVKTERGTAIRVHQSSFELETVQQMWQSVENAIFAEDGIDHITGKHLRELIDMDSWAELFLLDEILADYDGGKISKFFYYKEENGVGKIYGGPVWDKDDSLAPGHWAITPPNCIVASRAKIVDGKDQRLFSGIYQKEEFASRVTEIYQSRFLPLLQELCRTGIEEYANLIDQSAQLTEIRWNLGYRKEESSIIRNFLEERMDFFDAYWIKKEEFYHVKVRDTFESSDGEFAVRPGDPIPVLPEYDPAAGVWCWYEAGTEDPFDVTQPIWEDKSLILKKIG